LVGGAAAGALSLLLHPIKSAAAMVAMSANSDPDP
jgi:hypothetical protein